MPIFMNILLVILIASLAACNSTPDAMSVANSITSTITPTSLARLEATSTPPEASAKAPSEPNPTPEPPAPTATPVLITRVEDLVGMWITKINGVNWYARFNADGTCVEGYARLRLDSDPNIKCTFAFDGNNFIYTEGEHQRIKE